MLLNNPATNWILIATGYDYLPKVVLQKNNYQTRKYLDALTPHENVGYSLRPEIQKLVNGAQSKLKKFANEHLLPGQAILDIGCGAGLYLKEFNDAPFELYGIDLNEAFLAQAKAVAPKAHLVNANYITGFNAPRKFDLICSFSVTMYIEPSRMKLFFDKMYNDLNPGGYIFIQYSQAMLFSDLFYPELTYIKYSPHRIDKLAAQKFITVKHEHFYHGHKAKWYDGKHYYFPDGTNTRLDTLENSFLLVLQKPGNAS
ncbi:MAG TPA: class I SAM-dependent methyltransferase [Chitinophagales bacterium]|nr:class I SAM-dependent methyltransferase [Chitinophagales bacterium]